VEHAELMERLLREAELRLHPASGGELDLTAVTALDTSGAWVLEKLTRESAGGAAVEVHGLTTSLSGLLAQAHGLNRRPSDIEPRKAWPQVQIERAADYMASMSRDVVAFLHLLGAVSASLGLIMLRPARLRLTSTVYQLFRVGWQAIPIMLLITFLIGAIIAQQGIFHFRRFGAESYVVDMVGILVLREIGVLIVAIMVAGRSGSAYTAEIGSMKMREEIDALITMERDPIEVLIVPRVLALIIALPILAFLGSLAALYGGGLVAWLYGGMSPAIFIARLREAVSVTHFEVGLIKAPFMALVIGIVAAVEGLRVKGSAESLGRQTTASVVKSIFLVIVIDGIFAVFFASIGM
jgi:phospholipid/cholesterol/gamma-HCH transport system permease protein